MTAVIGAGARQYRRAAACHISITGGGQLPRSAARRARHRSADVAATLAGEYRHHWNVPIRDRHSPIGRNQGVKLAGRGLPDEGARCLVEGVGTGKAV